MQGVSWQRSKCIALTRLVSMSIVYACTVLMFCRTVRVGGSLRGAASDSSSSHPHPPPPPPSFSTFSPSFYAVFSHKSNCLMCLSACSRSLFANEHTSPFTRFTPGSCHLRLWQGSLSSFDPWIRQERNPTSPSPSTWQWHFGHFVVARQPQVETERVLS